MILHFMCACVIGFFSLLPLPQQDNDNTTPPAVERLPADVKSISAKSLPFNSQAARLVMSIPGEIEEGELRNTPDLTSPGNMSAVRSPDALLMGKSGVLPEQLVKGVNAMRILSFPTQPGEKYTFTLKSQESKVRLAVFPDAKATKMRASIKRANMAPIGARSKKLVFSNSSKEPYDMLLFVYGAHGYEYELSWENKGKK
jgi:hypothetical protein